MNGSVFIYFIDKAPDFLLVIVGIATALVYFFQKRDSKRNAARLITLQIDEICDGIEKIATYIVDGQLNNVAFYESLPLISEDYWARYKHFFVLNMDATSISAM
ncbi:hypothetical protein [Adlercreutzia sp. ZJ141]|uniref:hypothetical protein n=1 Tax=Adlercreutzia sp. ZJ141 TaxID=2709406 RepID=UPI0013EBF252|nr:hypothetical protein [Adlercreutzia sp. ZJ141]